MIDPNKKYWLYIASHVYCNIKDHKALLYNTQTGSMMEIEAKEIISMLQSLHIKKNLGAIDCQGEKFMNEPYKNFINEFCKKGMGNVVDTTQLPEKPIQLMPILNLQRDVDKKNVDNIGKETLLNLIELNVYLQTGCSLQCEFCKDYYLQSLCCHKTEKANSLEIRFFKKILMQIKYGVVGKLNLLGGNLFQYPYLEELMNLLVNFKGQIHFWVHHTNLPDNQYNRDFFYDIIITFPVDKASFSHNISLLGSAKTNYHFYVTSNEDYDKAIELIEKHDIKKYSIHPIYIKTNAGFFEENVYMNMDNLHNTKLVFRQIFARKKMNTHFFGSLTVFSNGDIYANINKPVLGNIKNDDLLDIIHKEMLLNTAWRMTRNIEPCSNCLYQYICPSPSNYELVINKPNLCHIKTLDKNQKTNK